MHLMSAYIYIFPIFSFDEKTEVVVVVMWCVARTLIVMADHGDDEDIFVWGKHQV